MFIFFQTFHLLLFIFFFPICFLYTSFPICVLYVSFPFLLFIFFNSCLLFGRFLFVFTVPAYSLRFLILPSFLSSYISRSMYSPHNLSDPSASNRMLYIRDLHFKEPNSVRNIGSRDMKAHQVVTYCFRKL